jgi:hypothetical protein
LTITPLEKTILALTRPLNGQYPRPWMTSMKNPEAARVFIVGFNQAKTFSASALTHDAYLDALYNRNGRTCRALYDQMSGARGPSPTRKNTDSLNKTLSGDGIMDIIETNVVCYSTPMSKDLAHSSNAGGKEAGREIFLSLLQIVRPKVLIAHGEGTKKELERVLGVKGSNLPETRESPVCSLHTSTAVLGEAYRPMIIFIPSLAPPKWNTWSNWAPDHFRAVSKQARQFLGA